MEEGVLNSPKAVGRSCEMWPDNYCRISEVVHSLHMLLDVHMGGNTIKYEVLR